MGAQLDSSGRVLCVDLDGTLIRTDLLHELLCRSLKRNPLRAFAVLKWWLRGRAFVKQRLAEEHAINPALLPFNAALLDLILDAQKAGRRVVLATSADQKPAQAVADHLGVFSEVIASDGIHNLSGKHKLAVLRERFGEDGFDYAGNGRVDLPIWEACGEAIVVSSNSRLIERVKKTAKSIRVLRMERHWMRGMIRALRPHQWVKNLLIFAAPIMAQRILDPIVQIQAFCAFAAFCCCSSAAYLLNDLADLDADREHHTKQHRPLAAGELPLWLGAAMVPPLILLSVLAASFLPAKFLLALALYFGATLAYSLQLKQIAMIDIVVLAGLYSLRILAGGNAVGILVSTWLLAFSMFLFLSLACLKRFSELYRLRESKNGAARGRGYIAGDMELVAQFGTTAGYISVLVLALYMNSAEVTRFYSHPRELWLICPLLLYWVGRIWLLAHRGEVLEDPIVFAIRDKVSYLVGLGAGLILLLAV